MIKNYIVFCFVLVLMHYSSCVFSQANPPSEIEISIVESQGLGCHFITDHQAGKICFDVSLKVNAENWMLQSYNIWMDYGANNSILSYHSDSSCNHNDGGFNNLDVFGKYRFLAGNFGLELPLNEAKNFHNFCLDIVMFSGLEDAYVLPGGVQFSTLVSSVNLVEIGNTSNAINPHISYGDTFYLSESSFLIIDPMANAVCDGADLILSAMPEDATGSGIVDCEPFQFLWTGPDGFETSQANFTLPIVDPVAQSGLYEFSVIGQSGCEGYESFVVDLTSCVAVSCEDNVTVQGPLNLMNSREARIEIIAQGDVLIESSLTFDAPAISLLPSFEVPIGVDFETLLLGCP